MNKLNQLLERFCARNPGFGIPNLMLYLIGGNVAVFLLDMLTYSGASISSLLYFSRPLILHGQIWRLFSFVFLPGTRSIFVFLLSMYFLWFIGTQLEREWGTAKFNCYYLLGLALTIVCGLITGTASSYYIELTMFLAFATLYPDAQFLLFFIIPIKAKWLGWLDAALLALLFLSDLLHLQIGSALLILISILNYLIFFWPELMYYLNRTRGRASYSRRPNVVQFKKAARDLKRRDYIHKCCVCGRTDTDYPDLEFRYCSRCAGYHCYCMDHINNHVHITEE